MPSVNTYGETATIVVTSIKAILYLGFLVLYVLRIKKLDSLASNNFLQKDRVLKIKIIMILILILVSSIHITLSEADQSYWMHAYADFSLVDILGIIDYCLQLYIITRQHKKKSKKSVSVFIFWCLNAAITFTSVVLVLVYEKNVGIIVLFIKTIALIILIILTMVMEQKNKFDDIGSLRQTMNQSNLLPVNNQSYRASQLHKLYIQFNRQFQITMKEENVECSFKIAVYIGDQSFIISKTQNEFLQLSNQLIKIFPDSDEVAIRSGSRTSSTNMMKYGEEKQKLYQNYLIQITKTNKFYVQPLMVFLNIAPVKRLALLNNKSSLMKKQTLNSEEQQKLKRPFFNVMYNDDKGKIEVSNPQILVITINKSKPQIIAFHHRLVQEKRLKMQLISEQPENQQLVHFIYRVVNSKFLWRCFTEWICLDITTQQKIYNMFDFWNVGFKNIDIGIIGHEIAFDKEGNIINLYLISITKKNHKLGQGTTLKKRFNEFVRLDKNIRKFTNQHIKNTHLPSLPPKFSPFGSKTSPKSRQIYFDLYLKELIKIQGINHCLKLLQFLEMDNEVLAQQFYNYEQSFKSEQFDSMNLDELQIDRNK